MGNYSYQIVTSNILDKNQPCPKNKNTTKSPKRGTDPDLQEKYPEAEVSLELHQDRNKSPLSEAHFWEIIALLDWSQEGNDEEVVEPAIAYLASGPVRPILEFAGLLSEKLYALDSRAYAAHIG